MDSLVNELYKNIAVKFTISIEPYSSPSANEYNFAIVAKCPRYEKGRIFTIDGECIDPTVENVKRLFEFDIKRNFERDYCKDCKCRECQYGR